MEMINRDQALGNCMLPKRYRPPEDESQPLFDSEDMQGLMESPSETRENVTMEAHLWVEKYTPRHFTELLSDDVSMLS